MLHLTDLREILRYVPQFRDRVFVIALDGAVVEDDNFANLLLDIALLRSLRIGVVLVHGAGLQIERLREYRERHNRLVQLYEVFQKLAEAWKPRLDTLIEKFGDRIQVTPRLTPSSREATLQFPSKLGQVRLRFSASTDRDSATIPGGFETGGASAGAGPPAISATAHTCI